MKPVVVPRRFIVELEETKAYLQFGYGTTDVIRTSAIVDPASVVLNRFGKSYETNTSFDPSKLVQSDKFGVAPSNTILTVVSRKNTAENVNVSVGSLNEVSNSLFDFENDTQLSPSVLNGIIESLEVINESSINGDISLPTTDELKRRIYDVFASQNRAVTDIDYRAFVYSMPPKFGAIKRCSIVKDPGSFKRNLNLYVIAEDASGALTEASATLKKNLKTWLSKGKMINDTIDILDAKIINVGLDFQFIAMDDENPYSVLDSALQALRKQYLLHLDIGEPFSISDVYSTLKDVDGLLDVVDVQITHKSGGSYSDTAFDIELFTSPDERFVACPENCIFEVRFPNADIKGSVV
jgi:hypothetical protein